MTDLGGSLDQLAHSASFPAWVAVCSAAFFGLVFLLSLVRAERTVANGALAALTFAGLAIAASLGLQNRSEPAADRSVTMPVAGLPALACIDDLAGETALAACENILFGAPDTVAAAVGYTAARINRLVSLSNAANAGRIATPDEQALRNSVERDRYGLVAYVLATRDKCQPNACAAFAAMTDHAQIASNMDGLIYEGLVARYAPSWAANNNPILPLTAPQPMALGKPSSIDYPNAASIPPVSIMTEPPSSRGPPAQPEGAGSPASAQAGTGGPYVPAPTANAPKKRSSQKRAPAASPGAEGPVQLSPSASQ